MVHFTWRWLPSCVASLPWSLSTFASRIARPGGWSPSDGFRMGRCRRDPTIDRMAFTPVDGDPLRLGLKGHRSASGSAPCPPGCRASGPRPQNHSRSEGGNPGGQRSRHRRSTRRPSGQTKPTPCAPPRGSPRWWAESTRAEGTDDRQRSRLIQAQTVGTIKAGGPGRPARNLAGNMPGDMRDADGKT